jgi:glutathione synthase/RimK-type ligase-like ATP-grasp enzyme
VLHTLDGVEPQIWELQRLEDVGIRLLNPTAALLSSHDKLATALLLHRAGIPHPATAHVDLGGNRASLDPPIVVKPRFGSWGRDVFAEGARVVTHALRAPQLTPAGDERLHAAQ